LSCSVHFADFDSGQTTLIGIEGPRLIYLLKLISA